MCDATLSSSPYSSPDPDFEATAALASARAAERGSAVWSFGRHCDWRFHLCREAKRRPDFWSANLRLWRDSAGRPEAYLVAEEGGGFVCFVARAGSEGRYAGMLGWAAAEWAPARGRLATEVYEDDAPLRSALEAAGWKGPRRVGRTRIFNPAAFAARVPASALPAGVRLVGMEESRDVAGKLRLYAAGFHGEDKEASALELLLADYYYGNSPTWRARLDISAVDASGLHLATCAAFVDPATGTAEIERVCTRPDARRRGLAAAAIGECLRRLAAEGWRRASITGFNPAAEALYESLGPLDARELLSYSFEP